MADFIGLDNPDQIVGKMDADFFGEHDAKWMYEDEQDIILFCHQQGRTSNLLI